MTVTCVGRGTTSLRHNAVADVQEAVTAKAVSAVTDGATDTRTHGRGHAQVGSER